MTSIPPELYALANAFLFAFHNMLAKKGLGYSNPATAVISSLVINIVFLWACVYLLRPRSWQSVGRHTHQQHRSVLLAHVHGTLLARRRTSHAEDWGRGAADVVEANEAGYDNAPGQIS